MFIGRPVSRGVARGKVVVRVNRATRHAAPKVADKEIPAELSRFHSAIEDSERQLKQIRADLEKSGVAAKPDLDILDVHIACLRDPVFLSDVERAVKEQKLSLESAISLVISNFSRIFELAENAYLKERVSDLRDVATRLLRNVQRSRSDAEKKPRPPGPHVLVTNELLVADMFDLEDEGYAGIVAESGGRSSHPVLMAKSLAIPMVLDVPGIAARVKDGDFLIVDGSVGSVHVNPSTEVRVEYEKVEAEFKGSLEQYQDLVGVVPRTKDGTRVEILVHVGKASDLDMAAPYHADGVGLFRTEFDFVSSRALPTESSLTAGYSAAAEAMDGKPVLVRLLEADSTRFVGERVLPREPNPALGVRSLRLLLRDRALLELQVRALLRASAKGKIGIQVPFVSSIEDYREARAVIDEVRSRLVAEGAAIGPAEIGVVVEVPGLVPVLDDLLAREPVDFVTIAIDNLTQYLMAADRTNGNTWRYFERSLPAVFRTVRSVVDTAARRRKPIHAFGDVVTDPQMTPLLLGLGLRRFSMSPISIPRVKQAILATRIEDAKLFAERALEAPDAASFAIAVAEAGEGLKRG